MCLQPNVNITVNSVPSGIIIDVNSIYWSISKHYLIIELSLKNAKGEHVVLIMPKNYEILIREYTTQIYYAYN